jgi:hypothetical protein
MHVKKKSVVGDDEDEEKLNTKMFSSKNRFVFEIKYSFPIVA